MLDRITDRDAEREQKNLGNSEESSAEDNVTDGPSILKRAEHEDELRDNIDDGADKRPEDVNNPEPDGLGIFEPGELLEGSNGNEEGDSPYGQARYPKELKSQCQEKLGELQGKERTQRDSGVPSSANWKPTNPFMSKQV